MTINLENEGDVLRVDGVEEIYRLNAAEFQRRIEREEETGARWVEIDMSRVTRLDCRGLGALIDLRDMAVRRGGGLRLLNPSPSALQFMEFTRANRLLPIVSNEETAPC